MLLDIAPNLYIYSMLSIKNYDAIIFDFGGVIINIDYNATIRAFSQLGLGSFEEIFSKARQNSLSDDFEKGLISEDVFFDSLNKNFAHPVETDKLRKAWNSMLLDIPQRRIDLLKAINSQMPTFLLSNTNDTHIREINKYLESTHQVRSVHSWFNKVYFSFEMSQRKPDAEIFETVLRENNLDPARTLFIDDSPQHIEAAKKLGIQTHHLLEGEDICDLLKR